jgi:hypothetical protein
MNGDDPVSTTVAASAMKTIMRRNQVHEVDRSPAAGICRSIDCGVDRALASDMRGDTDWFLATSRPER